VRALLKAFDTVGDIKTARFEDIAAVPGMDMRSAQAVVEYFESEES